MSEDQFAETRTELGALARDLLAGHQGDGPIQMLNLLRFVPDGGEAMYMEYMAANAPLGERFGVEVVSFARPAEALIGDSRWDLVLIARYPSRKAFVDMLNTKLYAESEPLRTRAVADSELHVMDPIAGIDPRG